MLLTMNPTDAGGKTTARKSEQQVNAKKIAVKIGVSAIVNSPVT